MSFLKRSRPFDDLPRFGALSPSEMRRVCEAGREVRVPKGWSLLSESTPPDQAYLVVEGTLEVRHHGRKVAELGRGDIVGEIGLTQHRLRTGTVTAATPLEMLHLTRESFQRLYDDIPAFREAVDETVTTRLAELAVDDGALTPARAMAERADEPEILERLEQELLGGPRAYTRSQVAERAGVPLERAERLWRALGFASTTDDEVVFGDRDVEALSTIAAIVDKGVVRPESEASVARSLGQVMARLADWQTSLLTDVEGLEELTGAQVADATVDLTAELVPLIEGLQSYVWRRHLVAAGARILPVSPDDPGSDTMVAGFADMVGFTSLSRSSSEGDLARLVETFESTTSGVIAEHGGRVVKTIGDEVLFVVQSPEQAARIALALQAWQQQQDDVPQLRIGMAHGRVISWLGDVYGPIVNVASRLTSVARPGTTVVDRDLAGALQDDDGCTLRRLRRVSVRGYARLEPWVLRPPT